MGGTDGRLTTPGRWVSLGSFCVMSRYRKAEQIMKLMRNPVPWTATAAVAMAAAYKDSKYLEVIAALKKLPASGATRTPWSAPSSTTARFFAPLIGQSAVPECSRGYAGKTQMGVMV